MNECDDIIVYILCPSSDTLSSAIDEYGGYAWARPILLPQTAYLESWMYIDELDRRRDEWMEKKFVGCMAHSAANKTRAAHNIEQLCQEAEEKNADFIGLMYRGDPLVATAEEWHPGFTRAWRMAWASIGWTNEDLVLHEKIPSFYCNYWLSSPHIMRKYCTLMRYLVDRMEGVNDLRDVLMKDSAYSSRGSEIAKISPEGCQALFGVDYYPMYIFVMERMICLFSATVSKNMVFVS
jgi:hypothetical protein